MRNEDLIEFIINSDLRSKVAQKKLQYPKVQLSKYNWITSGSIILGSIDTVFTEDYIPNRFHRFMQKILLGIYWTKIPDDIYEKYVEPERDPRIKHLFEFPESEA